MNFLKNNKLHLIFMFFSILVFFLLKPIVTIASTSDDIENAEKTIALVMRACLSSNKVHYKIKGDIDFSILKKFAIGGKAGGNGEFEKTDIVSYLPELKDELQKEERDAIRSCVNPLLLEILRTNNLLSKKVTEVICLEETREFKTNYLGVKERTTFVCSKGNVSRHGFSAEVSKNGDIGLGKGAARVESIKNNKITVYHWMDAGTKLKYNLKVWTEG